MKLLLLLAISCILPVLAYAHENKPLGPDGLWTAWEFDPGVVIPLVFTALLYAAGSHRHFGLKRTQRLCFWIGWITLTLALVSPLHPMGEALFSAHMVQHEMLMIVAAPLLVVSRPLITFLWALPFRWRRIVGRWARTPLVLNPWLWLTAPFVAWWIHAIAIWAWHAPALFQATINNDLVHGAQHLSF
ncbi:MAG: cytochrome c oxidase assembly protein, partial [Acidobacteriaceae bacterium]|nr:cytochrome c oxidase assembly protein [Acidobacteriaceae bacterium]